MTKTNSSRKGKHGERTFAKHLRELGFEARRGQQHKGGPESPDVVTGLEQIHFEVKFGYSKTDLDLGTVELERAFDQAFDERTPGQIACVAWKPRGTRFWRYTIRVYGIGYYTLVTYCYAKDGPSERDFLVWLNKQKYEVPGGP